MLLVWGWVESRTAQPMVDMRMLSRRPVLFTNLAALFCGFTMYAIFTVLPLFSQMPGGLPADAAALVDYGFGASVTVSALYLLPGAFVMLPAGPFGGVLGRWVGFRYALAIGLIVTAAGSAMLAAFHAEPWQLMLGYAIGAGGRGDRLRGDAEADRRRRQPHRDRHRDRHEHGRAHRRQRHRQPGRRHAPRQQDDHRHLDPLRVGLQRLAVARRRRRADRGPAGARRSPRGATLAQEVPATSPG